LLTVLHEKAEIARAQARFVDVMRAGAQRAGMMPIGWQGGQATREVLWHRKLDLWMCFDDFPGRNRYWSAFGTDDPGLVKGNLSIRVEVNSPRSGVNRRIGGAFAQNADGDTYVMHRGNIGGGQKGIGKRGFMAVYPGAIVRVADGNATSDVIILGRIEQAEFPASVAAFVHAVHRFKSAPGPRTPHQRSGVFLPEFAGTKTLSPRDQIDVECRHGIVVNSLQRVLESDGYETGNTREIDLCVNGGRKASALFEVKAADDPYSIYAAIGQLYFHSTSRETQVAVLPATCQRERLDVIRRLGIRVLLYKWDGQMPVFDGLQDVLTDIPRGSP
jgi:hypothetical protein